MAWGHQFHCAVQLETNQNICQVKYDNTKFRHTLYWVPSNILKLDDVNNSVINILSPTDISMFLVIVRLWDEEITYPNHYMIEYLLSVGHDAQSPLFQTDINPNCCMNKYSHPQFYVVSNLSPMSQCQWGLNYRHMAWMSNCNHALICGCKYLSKPLSIPMLTPVSRFKLWYPAL